MFLSLFFSAALIAGADCPKPHVDFTNSDLCVTLQDEVIHRADGNFEAHCVLDGERCASIPVPDTRTPVTLNHFKTNNDNPRAGWNIVRFEWDVDDAEICIRTSTPKVDNFSGPWIPTQQNAGIGVTNAVLGSQRDSSPTTYTFDLICYGRGKAAKGRLVLRTRVR